MSNFHERVRVSVLRFPCDQPQWHLVTSFLSLRKTIFIDKMKWDLFSHLGLEFEQYDYLQAVYVIAHQGEEVLGGARLIRCDWTMGSGSVVYSYMIRDAWRALLPGLPSNLCTSEPPVNSGSWELTRLTAVTPGIARKVLRRANAFLNGEEADSCMFLGPPTFLRMARSMGYQPEPLGPVTGNRDGRFLAFSCRVSCDPVPTKRPEWHRIAAPDDSSNQRKMRSLRATRSSSAGTQPPYNGVRGVTSESGYGVQC